MGIVSVAEGGLEAPGVYEFGEVEARWQGAWDESTFGESAAPRPSSASYYVLLSPPQVRKDPPLGQLKSKAFADALTRYHQVRGRRVLTKYAEGVFGDVQEVGTWPERFKDLQRDMAGGAEGVELIFGCTEVDQARVLTKTLARIGLMAMHEPYVRALALGMVTYEGEKPISPELCIEHYGADTVCCYLLFMGPHEHDLRWSDGQIGGVRRFLSRLWRLAHNIEIQGEVRGEVQGQVEVPRSPAGADLELLRKTHETIDHVTGTMESDLRFHLAIAAIMGLVSTSIRVRGKVATGTLRFAIQSAARLLFPFAPHCAADVYHQLTGERTWEAPWPVADPLFREGVPYPASS